MVFSEPFQKLLDGVSSTEDVFLKHLKRILEGKRRAGESLLPNKPLGKEMRSLVLLKGKVMDGPTNDRFVVVLYIQNTNVIPAFIAKKLSKRGYNVSKHDNECYEHVRKVLSYIQEIKKYRVEPLDLEVDRINLGHGLFIPSI